MTKKISEAIFREKTRKNFFGIFSKEKKIFPGWFSGEKTI